MDYMVTWRNIASGVIGTAEYCDRGEAVSYAEMLTAVPARDAAVSYAQMLRRAPDTYAEVLVMARGDNGYWHAMRDGVTR